MLRRAEQEERAKRAFRSSMLAATGRRCWQRAPLCSLHRLRSCFVVFRFRPIASLLCWFDMVIIKKNTIKARAWAPWPAAVLGWPRRAGPHGLRLCWAGRAEPALEQRAEHGAAQPLLRRLPKTTQSIEAARRAERQCSSSSEIYICVLYNVHSLRYWWS